MLGQLQRNTVNIEICNMYYINTLKRELSTAKTYEHNFLDERSVYYRVVYTFDSLQLHNMLLNIVKQFMYQAIGIINFEKPFLNFIDDALI